MCCGRDWLRCAMRCESLLTLLTLHGPRRISLRWSAAYLLGTKRSWCGEEACQVRDTSSTSLFGWAGVRLGRYQCSGIVSSGYETVPER